MQVEALQRDERRFASHTFTQPAGAVDWPQPQLHTAGLDRRSMAGVSANEPVEIASQNTNPVHTRDQEEIAVRLAVPFIA
jgi:hypothetical protein